MNNNLAQISNLRKQLHGLAAKQQQKINDFVRIQMSQISIEIDHLKTILRQNQDQLIKQKLAIDDLSEKIAIIETRTQAKLQLLSKQLSNFRKYYEQCNAYTVTRVNEVSSRASVLSAEIQKQFNNFNISTAIQYVQYAHQLTEGIIKNCSQSNEQLKNYVNQQIFQLELRIGNFYDYTEEIQMVFDDLKVVQFGNASLKQSIQASNKMMEQKYQPSMKDSQTGKKLVNFFEPKFKQILKRVNGYSMQIQMVKLMINSDTQQAKSNSEDKLKELKQIQQKFRITSSQYEEQKKLWEKQALKKQEILKKRHERILQLEQSLHLLLEKQIKMQHQISELKSHNIEFSKELKALQHKKQDTTEKDLLKKDQQKLVLLQIEYDNLLKMYKAQEQTIKNLKNSLIKRPKSPELSLSKSQKIINIESPDSRKRERSLTKSQKHSLPKTNQSRCSELEVSIKMQKDMQLELVKVYQQNEKLGKDNKQLIKINKSLQDDINNLLIEKARQNKQDEEYLDQVQAESQKNILQIQRLQIENLQLSRDNAELETENQNLENQLSLQIENFEQKSKSFKNIIYQLQKQIQELRKNSDELPRHSYKREVQEARQRKHSQSNIQTSLNPKIPLGPSYDLKASVNQERKVKKSNFLQQLEYAILSTGIPKPIICELDKNGYIRQQQTGNYLVDQNKNPMRVSEAELKSALQSGLILI